MATTPTTTTTSWLSDRRPADWTDYNKPDNREPVYGKGALDGYQWIARCMNLKPEYAPATQRKDAHLLVCEMESETSRQFRDPHGKITRSIVNRFDARWNTDPKDLAAQLEAKRQYIKATRKEYEAARAATWPGPKRPQLPVCDYTWPLLQAGQDLKAHEDAVKRYCAAGVCADVDVLVIDAHPHFDVPFSAWLGVLEQNLKLVGAYLKAMPVMVLMSEQWAAGSRVNQFLPEYEAVRRFAIIRHHARVWIPARYGGSDSAGEITYGLNPANDAINRTLLGV